MGQFIDSRKFLRTPGFAPDGLYDDERLPLPPLQDSSSMDDAPPLSQDEYNSQARIVDRARRAPLPPPSQSQDERTQRQQIDIPAAPLPPKIGKMRNILGTIAGMYLPPVGEMIREPGYRRAKQEYANQINDLQLRSKLDVQAAQAEANRARAGAEGHRGQAQDAIRRRTEGQMATDGDFSLPSGHTRHRSGGGPPIASNPLPPRPVAPGMKITAEEAKRRGLYVEPNAQHVEIPAGGSAAYMNTLPRANRDYDTLKQSIRDANPEWDQSDVDAEASKQHKEKLKLDADVKKHQANRPYGTGRSTGLTAAGQNAEDRRTVEARALQQIAEAGDLDKAISNMSQWQTRDEEAEKVLAHLKAKKGAQLAKPPGKGKGSPTLRGLRGGNAAPPKPAAPAPAPPAAPTGAKIDRLGIL